MPISTITEKAQIVAPRRSEWLRFDSSGASRHVTVWSVGSSWPPGIMRARATGMKFSYRLVRDARGYVAECVEVEAVGEGKSQREALASLQKALEERMFRPDAVAPPSDPAGGTIELVLSDGKEDDARQEKEKELDLGGPGDAPMP